MEQASASAPASIGNVGVGFDVLGQAFDAARDTVIAVRESEPGVRLGAVSGLVDRLPDRPDSNTALAAAAALLAAAGNPFGVRLSIDKGVPMSAGMGGSAASAVAAAAAVNALLPGGGVEAEVRFVSLPLNHPLARARNEENSFRIVTADGAVHSLCGKGAGRWPTAASVVSDVMDIQRALVLRSGAAQASEPARLSA